MNNIVFRQAVEYVAFFESGSDPQFNVSPQSGELLPSECEGTQFVVGFRPAVYGKLYQAKLIIQVLGLID